MTTIAITNLKGGSGKTALAVNLAALLAEQHRVLLIDLDVQADASLFFGAEASGNGLADALTGGPMDQDLVTETEAGVDLIPAGENLGRVLDRVTPGSLLRHRDFLQSYDYAVLDCPPGLGKVVAAAWAVSDRALVPVDGPEALRAVPRLEQAWHDLKLDIGRIRLVPTRFDKRRVLDRAVVNQSRKEYDGRVLRTIRESVVVRESAAWRSPLARFAPRHAVTRDLLLLSREVVHG